MKYFAVFSLLLSISVSNSFASKQASDRKSNVTGSRSIVELVKMKKNNSLQSVTSQECKDLKCVETRGWCNCADGWSSDIKD
jgi:hypothetical protein